MRQFKRWGPLLLPVHLLIALWRRYRGYDPHLDHPFEREAHRSAPRPPAGQSQPVGTVASAR